MTVSANATALAVEVQSRIAPQTLLELSRHRDASATTLDADWLGHQAEDAIARFKLESGVAYDGAQAWHVAAGVELTLFYAYQRVRNHERAEVHWRQVARLIAAAQANRADAPVVDDITAAYEPTTPRGRDNRNVTPEFDPHGGSWIGYGPSDRRDDTAPTLTDT